MPVQVGSPAPPFKANAYHRPDDSFKEIDSSEMKGRWVCLLFYPMDFTFVCPTELAAFNAKFDALSERGCDLMLCSCDSQYTHKAWCDAEAMLGDMKAPMLADMTKRIAMDYGVLLPDKGISLRGVFLIDPEGVLRWSAVYDLPVGRNTDEVLRTLDALKTGELTACNWKPGEATLKT